MEENNIWFDMLQVSFGAFLGWALSIFTIIISKALDKKGKLHLFYKLSYQKGNAKQAGIIPHTREKYLIIPVYFEFQNTSNTARVLRDVCLYLYHHGKKVAKMKQIQYQENKSNQSAQTQITQFGGYKNSYSFVLSPLSIQKQECQFAYQIERSKIDHLPFDEIRFSYFDEKNRIMECTFCKAPKGWNGIDFCYDNEYHELKCSKKKRRIKEHRL